MLKTKHIRQRICVSCRRRVRSDDLIRLTVDFKSGEVLVNRQESPCHGRSAYLCKMRQCLEKALKGTRLKVALEGRMKRNDKNKRTIRWPLERELIKVIEQQCTEPVKRCENTLERETSE